MTGRSETGLYHFSEDPMIERFVPRVAPSSALKEALVWAVDADHAYLYFFPRDCPRVAFCAGPETSDADVERFFGLITEDRIRCGVFRSVAQLEAAILEYLDHHNADPKPFVWTKSAATILEKVARGRQALESVH